MRLRYAGSASTWGFAIYRASHDDYENSYLPNGMRGPAAPKKPSTAPAASTSTTPTAWLDPATPDELTGAVSGLTILYER